MKLIICIIFIFIRFRVITYYIYLLIGSKHIFTVSLKYTNLKIMDVFKTLSNDMLIS